MTTFVEEGNCVGWGSRGQLNTNGQSTTILPNGQTVSWATMGPITTNDSADRSTIMPNPGKIIAMVYHCEINDSLLPVTITAEINRVPITGMTITIPAGGTGYFFSGPGVSEASKEFLRGDRIMFLIKKTLGESEFRGTLRATMMILLEIEFPDVPP